MIGFDFLCLLLLGLIGFFLIHVVAKLMKFLMKIDDWGFFFGQD